MSGQLDREPGWYFNSIVEPDWWKGMGWTGSILSALVFLVVFGAVYIAAGDSEDSIDRTTGVRRPPEPEVEFLEGMIDRWMYAADIF